MALYVHRAERSDTLVAALADVLAVPAADPLAQEVVAVPARGVERWLTQRLSHRLGARAGGDDGICAAVRFPSPARLLAEVVGRPEDDPWTPDRLVWPLLDALDEGADDPALAAVAAHVGLDAAGSTAAEDLDERDQREHRQGRRYATARRLAGLFTGYATARPALIRAWASGRDEDGLGRVLPDDLRWQPELWRRTRTRIAGPDPVERLTEARERLAADPQAVDLPARVSFFGPTALPAAHRELLAALARRRDVHLWLPHPSPALWTALDAAAAAAEVGAPAQDGVAGAGRPRAHDPSVAVVRNPLLASLGRDSREVHTVLRRHVDVDEHLSAPESPAARRSAGSGADSLLARLQHRMRTDAAQADRRPLHPADRSVQVHACHGATREVDVLRDVLARAFADDETLEPSDVLVLCPDIETFAPLISAAFGLADVVEDDDGSTGPRAGHPAHHIRVRLADRSLRQTNPVLGVMTRLLDLAGGRFTASEVLDLLSTTPVRHRFRLDEDDLEQIAAWVAESGVRWGVDADHRRAWRLAEFGQNTWRSGLDRLLVGVAMSEQDQQWLGLALPLDDVGSADIDRAGRLSEAVARLAGVLDEWARPRTLAQWADSIGLAVDLLTSVPPADGWQLAEMRRELATVVADAGDRAAAVTLRIDDVRALLARLLAGRPTRANFRTGTLTVCTMVPMRSVPHRVICLLGLDDGVFPRNPVRDGDDVTGRTPVVGERDPRAEDRQLLLDAVMAAGERLVVTYAGADQRTGAVRPPSVPVGELLDELDNAAGGPVREQVVVRHPLQPFDPRTVRPGDLGVPDRPFTFDPAALSGARAALGPRRAAGRFLAEPLPPARRGAGSGGDVDLADLVDLTKSPVKAFLRRRLDLAVPFDEAEPQDGVPVDLDNLAQWSVGERLLQGRLAGRDEHRLEQIEWRRGDLPPGRLGQRMLGQLLTAVRPLVDGTEQLRAPGRRSVDVVASFAPGRAVRGTVDTLHGSTLVTVTYSRLGPAARLAAWARLLTLTVAQPDGTWSAETVGRGRSGGGPLRASVPPVAVADAHRYLAQLVDVFDRAMVEPVPLPLKASEAYAERRQRRGGTVREADAAADQKWATGMYPGEDADPGHVLVWGADRPFSAVLADRPRADEQWSDHGEVEPHRFGQLALRLWGPLLDHETVVPL